MQYSNAKVRNIQSVHRLDSILRSFKEIT